MTGILALSANIIMLAVMVIYIRRLVSGQTIPNTATWLITFVVLTMNTVTYAMVVQGNLQELALCVLANAGVSVIFFYSLIKGKFAKIGRVDKVAVILATAIGAFWRTSGNAIWANKGVLFISFVPTIIGLLRFELRDYALPWLLAVVSYLFQIATILCDASGWRWTELVFPVLNGLLGNGSVAVAVLWQGRALERGKLKKDLT